MTRTLFINVKTDGTYVSFVTNISSAGKCYVFSNKLQYHRVVEVDEPVDKKRKTRSSPSYTCENLRNFEILPKIIFGFDTFCR